jgi:hypothetical protein
MYQINGRGRNSQATVSVVPHMAICFATPRALSTKARVVARTDGYVVQIPRACVGLTCLSVATRQLIAATGASQVALLILHQIPRPQTRLPRPGMPREAMVDVGKILAVPRAMQRETMEVAARPMGKNTSNAT